MERFFIGFEKNALAKWQKMLPTMSQKAKAKLRRYAGSGLKDVQKAREGMFMPKYTPKQLKRTGKMDRKIYEQFQKYDPDVRRQGRARNFYAQYDPEHPRKGYINLPRYGQEAAVETATAKSGKPTYRRAFMEHEKTELKSELAKKKRKLKDPILGKQRSIIEHPDVVHAGPAPLLAEANIAGRHPGTLKAMRKDWSDTPAQAKAFSRLKNVGWTPSRGLPLAGKQSKKFIGKVQKDFAPYARKQLKSDLANIPGRYKGKSLTAERERIKQKYREFAK